MPTSNASDQCATAKLGGQQGCATVPAGPGFYVYLAWLNCPLNSVCDGTPPARVVGVIWEETNGAAGLQRSPGSPPGTDADTAVLV